MTEAVASKLHLACPRCLTRNRVQVARLAHEPRCGQCGAALLDGRPVELDEAAFDAFIARTELPVLVDFWAPWCGPCRAMAPAFEQAARDLRERVRLVKVNTQDSPRIAERFRIQAIPTLILFRDGHPVDRVAGALDARSLVQWASR